MNKKVNRMLQGMSVLMKDEDPKLIEAMDNLINDRFVNEGTDGYPFDFKASCEAYQRMVKGKSY